MIPFNVKLNYYNFRSENFRKGHLKNEVLNKIFSYGYNSKKKKKKHIMTFYLMCSMSHPSIYMDHVGEQ